MIAMLIEWRTDTKNRPSVVHEAGDSLEKIDARHEEKHSA